MKVGIVCPYDWSYPGGVRSHILGLTEALPSVSCGRFEAEILAPATHPEAGVWVAGRTLGVPANGSVARICFGPGLYHEAQGDQRKGVALDNHHP